VLCPSCPFREVTSLASLRNDKDVVCPQGHFLLYPLASVISRGAHWLNHLATFSTRSSSRTSLLALLALLALLTHHRRWTLSLLDHGPMKQDIRNPIPAVSHTNMACLLGSGEFFFFTVADAKGAVQTIMQLACPSMRLLIGLLLNHLPTSDKRTLCIHVTFLNFPVNTMDIQILVMNMCRGAKRLLHRSTLSTLPWTTPTGSLTTCLKEAMEAIPKTSCSRHLRSILKLQMCFPRLSRW
jgi:hypothetical protein